MPNIHEKLESKPNNFGSQGEGVAGAYITLSTLGTTRKRINISHNSQPLSPAVIVSPTVHYTLGQRICHQQFDKKSDCALLD